MRNVAEAINEWREQHGLTQDDMAKLCGVSLPTAGNWCRGDSKPSLDHLDKLEAAKPGLIDRLFGELERLQATFDAGRAAGRREERDLLKLQLEKASKSDRTG